MIYVLAGVLAFLFGSGFAKASGTWTPPNKAGLDHLRYLCEAAGVPEPWIAFLAFVARGESGWNNLVGLGDPSLFPPGTKPNTSASAATQRNEAAAARVAFARNAEKFRNCNHPQWQYEFGSGGWFGMLPANGLAKLAGTDLVCLSPAAVFDPAASLVMALLMARSLTGWEGFLKQPTWLNLRVGWGMPTSMGKPDKLAAKREKFDGHRKDTGLPAGWLDAKVPPLPAFDPVAMYAVMQEAAGGAVS